ncbi:TOBE domain protein [compost metagenome]
MEISGLLHDIQYQGAATRYEIRLDNGQNFCVSQANSQWAEAGAAHQPGQRVTARWAREAMVALREDA